MKTNKKQLFVLVLTILAVSGMSFGSVSFAQTSSFLSCSVEGSPVAINQSAILTATGGNGTYLWSGQNLNIVNSAGRQFAVSYPSAGTYSVTVSSAGQSATCIVVVAGSTSAGNLICSPAVQNVSLGQSATFSVTGGNGSYIWSASDLTIANPTGSGFTANYASAGVKHLMVSSAGMTTSCAVNVISTVNIPNVPNFPNTGGGYLR